MHEISLIFAIVFALADVSSALLNGNLRASSRSMLGSQLGSGTESALDLGMEMSSAEQQGLGSMVSLQELLMDGVEVEQGAGLKALLLKASRKHRLGGIMYEFVAKGKYCDVNASYVHQGFVGSEDDCEKRCRQTVGCNYFTTYRNGWCQLSAVCAKQGLARDGSARTFAQVKRDLTFSQYSVGTRCVDGKDFLAQGMGMDCALECKSNKNCSYYTVYSNGFCELSSTCSVEEEAPTAVTYQAPHASVTKSKLPKSGTKICKKGKLLPNLYVLGTQKGGTTALAGDLVEAGVWNTKVPAAFNHLLRSHDPQKGLPIGAAAFSAIMNSAGVIASDLLRTGVMKPKDLSEKTKESIGFDLVTSGVLSTPTAKNLTDEANMLLAADLVKVGALDSLPISGLDSATQTFLTRDLLRACLLNGTICKLQDANARQMLEQDFVQASIHAGAFRGMPVDKLCKQTRHFMASGFMQAFNSKAELADHISDITMQSLMEDISRQRLALVAGIHEDQDAQDLTKYFKEVGALNVNVESQLGITTETSLADDLVVKGRLTIPCQGPCLFLQLKTRQSLARDINRHRRQQGWSLIPANKLFGESLPDILKDFDPSYLTEMSKVFLVKDLLGAGLLFAGTSRTSSRTRQLLKDDFRSAVEGLNGTAKAALARGAVLAGSVDFESGLLSDSTKKLLAKDFLRLIGSGDIANGSVAAHLMQALDIQGRTSLASDLMSAGMLTLKVADSLSIATKHLLTSKPSLTTSASYLRNYTLKFLGRDILGPTTFLDVGSKVWSLQSMTKQLITENFLSVGIMENSQVVARFSRYTKGLIAHDIVMAGLQNYTKGHTSGFMDVTTKEAHFFEHAYLEANYSSIMKAGTPIDSARAQQVCEDAWLQKLMDCPKEASPVYADFTPSNMRMVPLPIGTQARGRHWGSLGDALFNKNDKTGTTTLPSDLVADLPRLMSDIYGQDKKKPTFVIMLREPMARMQSAFYHARKSPGMGPCKDCKGESFLAAMNSTLQYARPNNKNLTSVYLDWMWTSMYSRQLTQWFQHFEPSQFYVIPTSVYTKGDKMQICKDVSARLRTEMDCSPFQKPVAASRNAHDHPTLEKEASQALRKQFDAVMDVENEHLFKVLAEAHKAGLGLATYEGKIGDKESIKEWLVNNW